MVTGVTRWNICNHTVTKTILTDVFYYKLCILQTSLGQPLSSTWKSVGWLLNFYFRKTARPKSFSFNNLIVSCIGDQFFSMELFLYTFITNLIMLVCVDSTGGLSIFISDHFNLLMWKKRGKNMGPCHHASTEWRTTFFPYSLSFVIQGGVCEEVGVRWLCKYFPGASTVKFGHISISKGSFATEQKYLTGRINNQNSWFLFPPNQYISWLTFSYLLINYLPRYFCGGMGGQYYYVRGS